MGCEPVGQRDYAHARSPDVRILRQSHQREVSSPGSTSYCDTFRIHVARRLEKVYRRDQILQVSSASIFSERLHELAAKPRRPSEVRRDHKVAMARIVLQAGEPAVEVFPLWTSMRIDDCWMRMVSFDVGWNIEKRGYRRLVKRRIDY